jgi:hypothetical protein
MLSLVESPSISHLTCQYLGCTTLCPQSSCDQHRHPQLQPSTTSLPTPWPSGRQRRTRHRCCQEVRPKMPTHRPRSGALQHHALSTSCSSAASPVLMLPTKSMSQSGGPLKLTGRRRGRGWGRTAERLGQPRHHHRGLGTWNQRQRTLRRTRWPPAAGPLLVRPNTAMAKLLRAHHHGSLHRATMAMLRL